MDRNWLNIIGSFFLLLFLQVFFFNQINLGIYVNVCIYMLFVIQLPANLSSLNVLLLSSAMGFSIDVFSSDLIGPHFIASILSGYLRPYLLKIVLHNEQQEVPQLTKRTYSEFFIYTGIIILIHLFVVYLIDALDFSKIIFVLIRTLLSATVSLLFISLLSLFYNKER